MATFVTAFFSAPDTPLTAPVTLPTCTVVNAITAAAVTSGSMTNLGGGLYGFTFASVDGVEYAALCDGDPLAAGQTMPGGRFVFGAISGTTTARQEIDIPAILVDTAAMEPLVSTLLDAAVSSRAVPGDAMDLVAGAIDAAAVAANAFADTNFAADMDSYQGKVWMFDDDLDATPADRYGVAFFKNANFITAGITLPSIRVIRAADGSDLVASTPLVPVAGFPGLFRYDETAGPSRIVDGQSYFALATATIDGSPRSWPQPVGRDNSP